MPLIQVTQDILTRDEPLFHQCNCVTMNAKGLAKQVFNQYPYANIYRRIPERIPGAVYPTPHAVSADSSKRLILNACAQFEPGGPDRAEGIDDSRVRRLIWFELCLEQAAIILTENGYDTMALPYEIGCGLAKGYWPDYLARIRSFSKTHPELTIYLCQLPTVRAL